jgi:hypothetical protein
MRAVDDFGFSCQKQPAKNERLQAAEKKPSNAGAMIRRARLRCRAFLVCPGKGEQGGEPATVDAGKTALTGRGPRLRWRRSFPTGPLCGQLHQRLCGGPQVRPHPRRDPHHNTALGRSRKAGMTPYKPGFPQLRYDPAVHRTKPRQHNTHTNNSFSPLQASSSPRQLQAISDPNENGVVTCNSRH